jgi:hypothetical protein
MSLQALQRSLTENDKADQAEQMKQKAEDKKQNRAADTFNQYLQGAR